MAKDPAVLFYTSDFLAGVSDLTMEERGQYITLLCLQHQKGRLSKKTISLAVQNITNDVLGKFTQDDEGNYYNTRMEIEAKRRSDYSESRRKARTKKDDDDVRIYIVRDNVRLTYKIGSSVNPIRRYNELNNQENPAIMGDEKNQRDLTLIWYSDTVLRTEENILHKTFVSKRLQGEWFALGNDDLNFIFNKYKGTYVERTENENENENINRTLNENELKNLLIPKMFSIFKTHNPTYMGSVEHDYKPLMAIARFLAGQGNIDPIKDKEQIFDVWGLLSEKISKDNFYCQKALITISNHIQSIAQTSVHGQKSKPGTSAARTEALRNW